MAEEEEDGELIKVAGLALGLLIMIENLLCDRNSLHQQETPYNNIRLHRESRRSGRISRGNVYVHVRWWFGI